MVATVALLSRLALALYLGVWGEPERWEYDVIAANIHAGAGHIYDRQGFVYDAYAPPLWSYALAGLLGIPGLTRASIQIVQALLCLGTAAACGALARRLGGGDIAAVLTGLCVALQPSLLYYSVVKSDPLPLNAFLLSLIALVGAALIEAPSQGRAIGAGLLIALATVSRGTPAIALPIMAILLILGRRARAVETVLTMSAAMVLGLAPWLVRNTLVLGEPLITSTSGENFWRGNNEHATGGVVDRNGRSLTRLAPSSDVFPPAVRAVLETGTEADRQRVFMTEAWRFIRANPADALGLFVRKMRIFWWRIDSDSADYAPISARLYEWLYRTELALALLGVVALWRRESPGDEESRRHAILLIVGLLVGISLSQSAFYVQGRHRFLIEPLLLIFSAYGLSTLGGEASAWSMARFEMTGRRTRPAGIAAGPRGSSSPRKSAAHPPPTWPDGSPLNA